MDRRRIATLLVATALLAGACSADMGPSTSLEAAAATTGVSSASAVPSPTDAAAPTPVVTMAPPPPELRTVAPVDGTDLPIAARDGAPGLVACGRIRPTTFEALLAVPAGAETRAGEEYDILRSTIAQYGDDAEFGFRGDTFREFRLDATTVEFLGSKGHPEGPFSSISVAFSDGHWRWAGMDGGCVMNGQPGPEWGWVNWTLNAAFDPPTAKTRTLHLLATEYECAGDTPLRGRLAPAWVFFEPESVRVQLFAQLVQPEADLRGCEADRGHGAPARAAGNTRVGRRQSDAVPGLRRLVRPTW